MSGGGQAEGITNSGQQRLPPFMPQVSQPIQQPVQGGARGGSGLGLGGSAYGGFMPNYGWNVGGNQPAYNNGPNYASPQYPHLYGGPWNQMTQMMAGPQYQAKVNPQNYAADGIRPNGWSYGGMGLYGGLL